MRVELGAPIVLVRGVPTLWHLPAGEHRDGDQEPTLCGLAGDPFVYRGAIARRDRHCCHVCLRDPAAPRLHRATEPEPPPRPLDRVDDYYGSGSREWPPRAQLEHATKWVA